MPSERDWGSPHPTERRVNQILNPDHPLCREDVIWMLGYIKKKAADEDPAFLNLSPPRLLKNYYYFAEAAMALIHRRHCTAHEADRLRSCLLEASYGLFVQEEAGTAGQTER
ncbi:hypothetical protein [Paenibacillus sp. NPDC058071]|uniref:hypothetical protein n=1 Tax=Paenibacillus sp. NPDC058071 TaxID=3346326 RepID=UPI0036DD5E24